MNFLIKLHQSKIFKEYQSNRRLQWMMLAVVAIITLSLLKHFSDELKQVRLQTLSQIELLARLELAAVSGLDEKIAKRINSSYLNWINDIPTSPSSSVAEAQALSDVEQQFGKLLKRKRLNLVGSESLLSTEGEIWQVRIEISGQMVETDLINLLQNFDKKHKYVRLSSFSYSPKTANSINLVVDLLYARAKDA